MNKLKKVAVVIVLMAMYALVFSGCSGEKEETQKSTGNIQEVALPAENMVITDMKTDRSGSIIIATMETKDDGRTATAAMWKLNEDETWEKMFEGEFTADASKDVSKEAVIDIIGNYGIIRDYDLSNTDFFSYEYKVYRIDSVENNEIEETFIPLRGHAIGTICGDDMEDVYGMNSAEGKIVNMNFITDEMKYVDELSEVTEMCSYGDSAYVIYRQEFELTEEEEANLTPMSDYPERYARGVIYDMNDGTIIESQIFDKLAVRFFQKWHKGGPEADNFEPIYYPAIDSEEEAYYLAHNDGIYRIDEAGEELICYDESWASENTCLNAMTVTPEGDIYLIIYFINGNEGEVKFFKIWQ